MKIWKEILVTYDLARQKWKKVTDKRDKQLKEVTSMVEQQTHNLREDLSRNI
jgi:hypothetical protein